MQAMTTSRLRGKILYDEPMSRHTSWRTGGKADRYFMAEDINDLAVMMQSLPADEPLLWLGLGSNTLVRDGGFRGTVISTQGVMSQLQRVEGDCVVVGASVPSAKLARFCAREHLTGAEFFAGIPGLVGGALAMNAGAFGGETWKQVVSVETINRRGEIHKREPGEYEIAYRSVTGPEDEWFTAATMKFESGDSARPADEIKALLARRAETQPTGAASCGSVFRNPESDHAARLIEKCGLKGKRVGGAVVSEKHANFIINDSNATASNIETLIQYVQQTVAEKCGVQLETEVQIVGESL